MKKIVTGLFLVMLGLAFVATPLIATAHRTGNERRTIGACRAIEIPAKRRACIACVRRPAPHHFHPNFPPGTRCRPSNGRP